MTLEADLDLPEYHAWLLAHDAAFFAAARLAERGWTVAVAETTGRVTMTLCQHDVPVLLGLAGGRAAQDLGLNALWGPRRALALAEAVRVRSGADVGLAESVDAQGAFVAVATPGGTWHDGPTERRGVELAGYAIGELGRRVVLAGDPPRGRIPVAVATPAAVTPVPAPPDDTPLEVVDF